MPKRVSLPPMILVLALANLDSPPSGFAQEKATGDKVGQQDVIHRDVDLVSVYFTVRDDKSTWSATSLRASSPSQKTAGCGPSGSSPTIVTLS